MVFYVSHIIHEAGAKGTQYAENILEVIMFWFKFLWSLDMVAVEQVKSHYPIYPKIIFRFTHTGMHLWALRE